jgi:hypothetical protein
LRARATNISHVAIHPVVVLSQHPGPNGDVVIDISMIFETLTNDMLALKAVVNATRIKLNAYVACIFARSDFASIFPCLFVSWFMD